jgi:hypothetical protein
MRTAICISRPVLAALLSLVGLVIPSPGNAQRTVSGDWAVDIQPAAQEAYTTNASQSMLGVLCFVENRSCVFYFKSETDCINGQKSVAMVNGASGAFSTTVSCVKIDGANGAQIPVQKIDDFGDMKTALESGNEIGIAVPLKSGQFAVSRFSAFGASTAIQQAMTLPKPSATRSRDQVL